MIRFAGKVCSVVAIVAAIGIGAGPVSAAPGVPLEPVAVQPEPILQPESFVPDTGSAAAYNNGMCALHAVAPNAPCMYT